MIKPEVLDAMLAAGCTAEQIVAAVNADAQASLALAAQESEANDARKAHKREVNAARQRRARERNAVSRVTDGEDALVTHTVSPKKETSPTPPKEKTTPSNLVSGFARDFAEFWTLFPNKVGKRKAEVEFAAAIKRDTFDAIMAGLRRYVAKTDDRPWCNPATFLHQDRWADEPSAPLLRPPSTASPRNGKPNAFDAYEQIARERGWNEPEILPGTDSDAQRFSPEQRGHPGAVVDLRTGADWHRR